MKTSFRLLCRQLTQILCCCLLVTALTGIILGLSGFLIDLPNVVTKILIAIHQGAILGSKMAPVYVLVMGLGVFVLKLQTLTKGGYGLLFQQTQPITVKIYRVIDLILVIPLAFCVEAGVAYRLGKDWFGISNEQTATFLSVHKGSSLGMLLSIFYLLSVGLSLIILAISSWKNRRNFFKQKQHTQTLQQESKLDSGYSFGHFNKKQFVFNNKVKIFLICGSIALLCLLFYTTSALFAAIAGQMIIIILCGLILGKKFHNDKQERQQTTSKIYEREVESITMLRAIPDSILRMSHEGICLSYIPAKETTSFALHGNAIGKHITEFLALEIAEQFIKSTQMSLKTGSTIACRFSIPINSQEHYHEARVTPIGQTEVLILVREIDGLSHALDRTDRSFADRDFLNRVRLITEPELIRVLDGLLPNIKQDRQNHILLCLAISSPVLENGSDCAIDDRLLLQIAKKIDSILPSSVISRLENHDLIILVSGRTIEKASAIVDDLHRNLQELISIEGYDRSIEFSIALLEIDANSSNAISLVNTAKATCQMAKQKVNFKAFW